VVSALEFPLSRLLSAADLLVLILTFNCSEISRFGGMMENGRRTCDIGRN
jgi:predicted ester cyclase